MRVLLLALLLAALAWPATGLAEDIIAPPPYVAVTPADGQLQWGQTASFNLSLKNPFNFEFYGLTAEVVNTVDRRWLPIRAQISPPADLIGSSTTFWRLAQLGPAQTLDYTVTVRLPALHGQHTYCFAGNLYLLPSADWAWPWADSASYCALVG